VAVRYVMVRMPRPVYDNLCQLKAKMEGDLFKANNKQFKLTLPKVINASISPRLNQNFIEIDLNTLKRLSKRGVYE